MSSYIIAANSVLYVDCPGYLQVQIGQTNNLSAVSGEGGAAASDSMESALLPIKDKGHLSKFRRVSGESALLWFSLKFLPAFLSVLVLVLVGRKR